MLCLAREGGLESHQTGHLRKSGRSGEVTGSESRDRLGAAEQIYFSFDEKRINLQKALHFVYRNIKSIPYYKPYTQDEVKALLGQADYPNLQTYREGQNAFVTSIR